MQPPRRLLATLGAAALTATCALFVGAPAGAATYCTDSWGSDGHNSPWFTSGNGGTLHGNTLKITCPSSTTFWDVDYFVWKQQPGGSIFFPINSQGITGRGSTSFSESRNPLGCNQGWDYGTQVHNEFTGGNITKPNPVGVPIC